MSAHPIPRSTGHGRISALGWPANAPWQDFGFGVACECTVAGFRLWGGWRSVLSCEYVLRWQDFVFGLAVSHKTWDCSHPGADILPGSNDFASIRSMRASPKPKSCRISVLPRRRKQHFQVAMNENVYRPFQRQRRLSLLDSTTTPLGVRTLFRILLTSYHPASQVLCSRAVAAPHIRRKPHKCDFRVYMVVATRFELVTPAV